MFKLFFIFIWFTLCSACRSLPQRTAAQTCPNWNEASLIYASQSMVHQAQTNRHRREKISLAEGGLNWAEKCVASFPQSAGCDAALAEARKVLSDTEKRLTK